VEPVPADDTPPVIDSSVPGTPHKMYEGASATFEVYATDVDGDPLGYAWVLDGAAAGDDAPQFTWTAPAGSAGEHRLSVSVSDGRGGIDGHLWAITVVAPSGGDDDDDDEGGVFGVDCAPGGASAAPLSDALPFVLLCAIWVFGRLRTWR
jgi:hypothetical protein